MSVVVYKSCSKVVVSKSGSTNIRPTVQKLIVDHSRRGPRGVDGAGGRTVDLSVSTDGQTQFTVPVEVASSPSATLFINGIAQRSPYFTIAGTILTWAAINYPLRTTNTLHLTY